MGIFQTGGRNEDAHGSHSFSIDIDGLSLGQFTNANGLEMETEVVEYREGGNNRQSLKFRGAGRYPNITLERGFTASDELWRWFVDCQRGSGAMPRKDGSIVLHDQEGNEVCRWNFFRGWPCRWVGPALQSEDSGGSVEVLEIAHELLEFQKGR